MITYYISIVQLITRSLIGFPALEMQHGNISLVWVIIVYIYILYTTILA